MAAFTGLRGFDDLGAHQCGIGRSGDESVAGEQIVEVSGGAAGRRLGVCVGSGTDLDTTVMLAVDEIDPVVAAGWLRLCDSPVSDLPGPAVRPGPAARPGCAARRR